MFEGETAEPRRDAHLIHLFKAGAWKQLRMLSVNVESSTRTLGEEAVNLLFEKHRLNALREDMTAR